MSATTSILVVEDEASFVDALLGSGRARALDPAAGPLQVDPFPVEPLRETARVAAEVRARLGL